VQVVLVAGVDPIRNAGGHESYVVSHGLAARAAGFSPSIFCLGSHNAEEATEFGTLRRIASPVRPFRGFMVALHSPFLVAGILRFLRHRPGPVLLHAFGIWSYVAAKVAEALRRQGRSVASLASAYTSHRHESREKLRGLHRDHGLRQRWRHTREYVLLRLIGTRAERRGYQAQDLVLVNYEAVRRRLIADCRLSVEIRQVPYAAPAAFRQPLALQPASTTPVLMALQPVDAPLIVSVSRQDPRKGVDVLLRALAALDREGRCFRACVLSAGPLLRPHRQLAAKLGLGATTALPGRVIDPSAFLRHADVFVLPSLQEGSGSLSLLEAMQAGCAVVASACDGLVEDLVDGDNALLVPRGDVAALSAALGRLLADDELRRRLAFRARATYEERFSAGRFAAALGRVYKTMIDALTNTVRATDGPAALSLDLRDGTHAGAARDSELITAGAAGT
jgi:glycosyltransferase involved in cell wall biosynthesis